MSSRLFQGVVHQMRSCINKTIGVIDDNRIIVACSDLGRIGDVMDVDFIDVTHATDGIYRANGFSFKGISINSYCEYAVFVEGNDEDAARDASILSVSFANIKEYYDEKYSKANFIKNIIMDNIMPGDIYLRARRLHLSGDVTRCVLLVRVKNAEDFSCYEILSNIFPDKSKDFVVSINESDVAIVKEVPNDITNEQMEALAHSLVNTLSGEFFQRSVIGIGSPVSEIRDLARSFKEAQIALEVGKVFDSERIVMNYGNLGIARLIYQLPTTLCESFMKEIFKAGPIESLDQETLMTIKFFFDNNLNVSETSRRLFVHRNTLVYRLEKIKNITGLDLRRFDHAIVFKIALMVNKYLKANPVKY